MFIRVKKIKGQEYAYLVKNTWKKRKKSSRQKTLRYLGKIIKLQNEKKESLQSLLKEEVNIFLTRESYQKIIKKLVQLTLYNHNFIEKNKNKWIKENYLVDLKEREVKERKTNKLICLETNNNFLCSYTLKKLLNFIPREKLTDLQVGKQLATMFEAAGIPIQKEVFVIIAQKMLAEIRLGKYQPPSETDL